MKSKTRPRQIALAFPSGLTFVERILKGFVDYSRKRGGWSFVRIPERMDPSLHWLRNCDSDGALIMVSNEQAAETARSLPMPVVNLSAYFNISDLPTVMVDQQEIARIAARHLLERNHSRFAYYGTSDLWYSRVRRETFVETVEAAGGECQVLEVPTVTQNAEGWKSQRESLDRWLRTLRPPVGIMASTDFRACMLAHACAQAGLRIPEDVALIGVDNEPTPEFQDPPLSSVSRNDAEVGLRAAALLDHLMEGGSAPAGPILVPPDGVVCRHSTEPVRINRARIARAVRFIHRNIHRPFGVEELLVVASMPRGAFEQHFINTVGIPPDSFIDRCRVERATDLLASTPNRSLTEIASLSGFCNPRRFRQVFRRLVGMPPAVYLRQKKDDSYSRRKNGFSKSFAGQSGVNRLAPC
jgi:LacI family transcriptional regulator